MSRTPSVFFATGTGPNPALVTLEQGPLHAIRIVLGDLGSKGGALIDTDGRAAPWVFACVALLAGSVEAANALGFMVIFPLTFASSAFVPPESMPAAIQWFAEVNPISTIVDATRALFVDAPAGNDVWAATLWCIGLIAVFSTFAVYRYRRSVSS